MRPRLPDPFILVSGGDTSIIIIMEESYAINDDGLTKWKKPANAFYLGALASILITPFAEDGRPHPDLYLTDFDKHL